MRSRHVPEHSVYPSGQESVQSPSVHTCPAPQVVPHAPQLYGSDARSTHPPPQSKNPPGHPWVDAQPPERAQQITSPMSGGVFNDFIRSPAVQGQSMIVSTSMPEKAWIATPPGWGDE